MNVERHYFPVNNLYNLRSEIVHGIHKKSVDFDRSFFLSSFFIV